MKTKKKWPKVLLIIVLVCAGLFFLAGLVNYCCNLGLRKYINSFEAVEYDENRLVPQMGEEGFYTYITDDELEIMHITDFHIGGGFWTYKRDKKSIYEVITMLQKEKPDLVILGGDNTYALFGIGYNGGFTLNNKMVAKTLISVFEHEQVYFSTVFGNHDTEAFDYASRQEVGNVYLDDTYKYCIFEEDFTDEDAETVPSVSNQFILVKNSEGKITKLVVLLDTNAYVDTHFFSSVFGKYDTIHQAQIDWAAGVIKDLSLKQGLLEGEYLKSLVFVHIPVGEYMDAYNELFEDVYDEKGNLVDFIKKENPENTEFLGGFWDEKKVYYGGISNEGTPAEQDMMFEILADEMHTMEAMFCGHDHVNNGVVLYKGVMLDYGYSIDNIAYGNKISNSGLQRGATVITINSDGTFTQEHRNAYTYYGCENNKFVNVDINSIIYPDLYRTY